MKGDVITVMMYAIVILLIITAVVAGISIFQTAKWGPCWANLNQNMDNALSKLNKLKTVDEVTANVTLGECVWMLDFVSKNDMEKFKNDPAKREITKDMACPKGQGGYLVALPLFEGQTVWTWRFWTIPENLYKQAKDFWAKNARGVSPLCKALDKDINSCHIPGPGSGKSRNVKLNFIKKADGSYGVSIDGGSCA